MFVILFDIIELEYGYILKYYLSTRTEYVIIHAYFEYIT